MSNVVYPPLVRYKPAGALKATVFLAGTIDMGDSADWQAQVITEIGKKPQIIYNPRRAAWDSSWEQNIDSEHFNVQVSWELEMIERADLVLIHFAAGSKSPVTMAEFGLCCALKPGSTIVSCPPGYYRKGNIDIMCERYGIRRFEDLDNATTYLKNLLDLHQVRGR